MAGWGTMEKLLYHGFEKRGRGRHNPDPDVVSCVLGTRNRNETPD